MIRSGVSKAVRTRAHHVAVVCFAMAAVLFTSGETCTPFLDQGFSNETGLLPDAFIVLHCDPGGKKLQAYATNITGAAFGIEQPVDGPVNGKPCSDSTDFQGRPYSISEAEKNGILRTPPPRLSSARIHPQTSQSAPAPAQTGLISLFSNFMPLLFGPSLPAPDVKRVPSTCDITRQAFLVNHLQNSVTVLGVCPLRVLKEITVSSNPLQVALTPDGTQALVTSFDGALIFIDTATYAVSTLVLTNYNPSGIAISPDGTRAYLTHYVNSQQALLVIDIPNRKMLTTIPLQRQYPRVVVLTPDGTQAWVNYYNDTAITIVDLGTASVASTLTFSSLVSRGMVFNPQGTKAFIAVQPDQLYIVDTATQATLARLTVGNGPNDVIMMPEGDVLAVGAEYAPGTWWINPVTNKIVSHTVPQGVTTGGSMGMLVTR